VTDLGIWSTSTSGPGSGTNDPSEVNLGTEMVLAATAWIKAIRYWSPGGNVDVHTGCVYDMSTQTAVAGTTVTFPSATGPGWQTAVLATPVQVSAGHYKPTVNHPPNSTYAADGAYWSTGAGASGITNGILSAPNAASATGGMQGTYHYAPSLTYPDAEFNSSGYWIDWVVSDTDPAAGGLQGTAADTAGATDSATTALDAVRAVADTAGLADTASATVDAARTQADTAGLGDTATASLDLSRALADVAGASDAATATTDFDRAQADALGAADTASTTLDAARTNPEQLAGADQVAAVLGLFRTAADLLGATDTATAVLSQPEADWDITVGPPTLGWTVGPPTI